jgi:hypothetical protein
MSDSINPSQQEEASSTFDQWPADFFKPPSVPLGGHIPGISDVPPKVESIDTTSARIVEEKPKRISLVIDANVIIKQLSLRDILGGGLTEDEFSERYEVHTLRDVIKEIKD